MSWVIKKPTTSRPWWAIIITSICVGWIAWLDTTGVEPFVLFYPVLALLTFLSLLFVSCLVVSNRRDFGFAKARGWVIVTLFLIPLIAFGRPGLRICFWLWRGSLERLADKVERGEQVRTPVRIGPYIIKKAELRYGAYVQLETVPDANGPTGFVRARGVPGNARWYVRLSSDWTLFSED